MLGPHIFGLSPVISSIIFATAKQSSRLSASGMRFRKSLTLSFVGLVFASAIDRLLTCGRIFDPQLLEIRVVLRRVVIILPHSFAISVHRALVQIRRRFV